MKKTVAAHLSGVLFNIEEDAYLLLLDYLKKIESYVSKFESKKEILEDIENRIAEIFSQKLSTDKKQVVELKDVEEVITQLGKPEDIVGLDEEQTTHTQGATTSTKRLYRDPDNKILAGVCGGIGTYFNIDPVWIRLVWAIAILFFGSGLLLYVILWAIIPEAKTPTQKLEMRGEDINLMSIGKAMEKEAIEFGKRASKFGEKITQSAQKPGVINSIIHFIQSLISYFLKFLSTTGIVILKILSVFLLIVALIILIISMAPLFGESHFIINTTNDFFDANINVYNMFSNTWMYWLFKLSIFMSIGILSLIVIIASIKFILNIKKNTRILYFVLAIISIIGWILLMVILPYYTLKNFSEEVKIKKQYSHYIEPSKVIYLRVIDDENTKTKKAEMSIKILNHQIITNIFNENEDKPSIGYPVINIIKSKDDSTRINFEILACGKDKHDAKNNAQSIEYKFFLQDSIIELPSHFSIGKSGRFNYQFLTITIEVPQNRYVYLSKNLKYYLSDNVENNINADVEDMAGKKWLMGYDGLICLEHCDEIANFKKHSYKDSKKKQKDETEDNEEE